MSLRPALSDWQTELIVMGGEVAGEGACLEFNRTKQSTRGYGPRPMTKGVP